MSNFGSNFLDGIDDQAEKTSNLSFDLDGIQSEPDEDNDDDFGDINLDEDEELDLDNDDDEEALFG
jgi:hypothetical protein